MWLDDCNKDTSLEEQVGVQKHELEITKEHLENVQTEANFTAEKCKEKEDHNHRLHG